MKAEAKKVLTLAIGVAVGMFIFSQAEKLIVKA